MAEWIIVPGWEKHQHYKTRDVPWIKVYTELNSRDDWLTLSTAARGLLVTLWVEYARSGGHLRAERVMQLCGKSARRKHLQALCDAGFIEISSRPYARARARSRETDTVFDSVSLEADSLPIKKTGSGEEHEHLTERLLEEIRDANERTVSIVRRFENRLPPAAFAAALESLRNRRTRFDRPTLKSEARYVVAALQTMDQEGQYR